MSDEKYIRRRTEYNHLGEEMVFEEEMKFGYPKSYEKWGIDVVKAGYTLLPNHFININLFLSDNSKLSPPEMMVLIVILSNWWDPYKMPAASKKYIGDRLNLSPRQVQRILNRLQEKKVIVKRPGNFTTGGASLFDIQSLLSVVRDISGATGQVQAAAEVQLEFDFEGGRKIAADAFHDMFPSSSLSDDDEIPF